MAKVYGFFLPPSFKFHDNMLRMAEKKLTIFIYCRVTFLHHEVEDEEQKFCRKTTITVRYYNVPSLYC